MINIVYAFAGTILMILAYNLIPVVLMKTVLGLILALFGFYFLWIGISYQETKKGEENNG